MIALPGPGQFLAASRDSLLFHTADAGDNWRRIAFPLELNALPHALLAPRGSSRWFVGVSPENTGASGLWVTSDGGGQWRPLEAFLGRPVWALAAFPRDPSILAAGASDGVYGSRDGGITWTRWSPAGHEGLAPVVALAFGPDSAAAIYAGTPHLPWRTTDGGATWQSAHKGMIDDSDVFAIHVDRLQPLRVFASACSGMYASADAGSTWTKLRGSPDASFRTYSIAQNLADPPALFAGTSRGLIRSVSGGATWREVLPHQIKAVAFDSGSPQLMFAATNGGPYRSRDGGLTFHAAAGGFAAVDVRWIRSEGTGLHAAGASGTWRGVHHLDADGKWTRVTERPFIGYAASGSTRYGITERGVFRRTGNGAWLPVPAPRGPRAIELASGALLIGADGGLFQQTRGRTGWTPAVAGLTGRAVHHLGGSCALARDAAALRTAAGWKMMRPPAAGAEWRQAAASGSVVLAATSHGLFRSTDEGQTWVPSGLAGQDTATAVLFHPSRPEVAFAAQSGRIYVSRDRGLTWRQLGAAGLGSAFIRAFAIVPTRPDRLYALASARGIHITSWEN